MKTYTLRYRCTHMNPEDLVATSTRSRTPKSCLLQVYIPESRSPICYRYTYQKPEVPSATGIRTRTPKSYLLQVYVPETRRPICHNFAPQNSILVGKDFVLSVQFFPKKKKKSLEGRLNKPKIFTWRILVRMREKSSESQK